MKVIVSFLLFLVFSVAGEPKLPIVVSLDWLKSHLNDTNTLVIDVRKEELYKKGHIKGAVNLPVMDYFFTKKTLRLPKMDFLKELFSSLGIDKDTNVVVYDNGQFCWAARAVWVLKVVGHDNAGLLRYAYGKKIEEEFPISVKNSPKRERKNFVIKLKDGMIASKLDTYMAMLNKTPILDGRTKDMYMGKTSIAKRYGHIPTAKLFSGSNNYHITDRGNRLKDFSKLKDVYKGLPKDKPIIIYCQDGADAALDYFMMHELGYNAIVYEGSWLEWANDFNMPVENPSAKEGKSKKL